MFVSLLFAVPATGEFLSKSWRGGITATHPFYHSTADLHQQLKSLEQDCGGLMSLSTESQDGVDIDVVKLAKQGATPKNKFMMLFGEHARELISPESALHFVKSICGKTEVDPGSVLDRSEFMIITNGNPKSRAKVEGGDYCLRVNERGVDLNRNWDEHFEGGNPDYVGDTNPGPKAFSEAETQIFKKLAEQYRPTSFLTIHSGTRGMYMPYAFDMDHLAPRKQKSMLQMLTKLDEEYCQCPFGAAGREVGYSCPGTCLDYVYDKLNTDYAFAFEIYYGEDDGELKERFQEKMHGGSFLQLRDSLAHHEMRPVFEDQQSDFIQLAASEESEAMTRYECFSLFNPDTEVKFNNTVTTWSTAYVHLADMIAADLQ
eukprot:CAMPEP_0204270520 /NCGR_PEP_ID=MMETSP0468-20130131/18943_1 /ASSEMBLY_ACC=CAM_ASM_000383 /TAXON_ID=2969 /ORGANISM="Oxyrrhis marina" /LENGTH=372 /DNA_ID=CAMNT_0051246069 /DNA_START=78 /DNA_END=1196 /DNA_ORIENTATION=+